MILRFDALDPGKGYVTMLYAWDGMSILAPFSTDTMEDLACKLDRAVREARA